MSEVDYVKLYIFGIFVRRLLRNIPTNPSTSSLSGGSVTVLRKGSKIGRLVNWLSGDQFTSFPICQRVRAI